MVVVMEVEVMVIEVIVVMVLVVALVVMVVMMVKVMVEVMVVVWHLLLPRLVTGQNSGEKIKLPYEQFSKKWEPK